MITEWIKIKRDKAGFATEECLNEMFKHDMFVVRDKGDKLMSGGYYLCKNPAWRREIELHIEYTHYLPIKELI